MQRTDFEHTVNNLQKQNRAIWFMLGALLLFSGALGVYSLMRTPRERPPVSVSDPSAKAVTIPIEGMTCASCVARVKKTLKSIDGVVEVEVSLEQRDAQVRYLDTKVSPERLAAAINDLGYRAKTPTSERTR